MKAVYVEGAEPGYGKIVLSEAIFPGGPWSVAIQRSSDQNYLSAKGGGAWVGETVYQLMDGEALSDGSLALAAGPEIVDCLDPLEQYAIDVKGDGETVRGRLSINAITYSAAGRLGSQQKPEQPQMRQSAAAAANSDSAPEQEQTADSSQAAPTPEPLQMPQSQDTGGSSRKIWRWALLALLIAGCAAWYLFDPRKEQILDTARHETAQSGPRQASAEEQVRQFFAGGNASPKAAADLAAALPAQTDADKDAIYRLWYFAAENGENSILQKYGHALDPSMPKFGSIEKDGAEAWHIYQKWEKTDPEAADRALQRLASWLARETSQGNAKARQWLFNIDQNGHARPGSVSNP